MGVGLGPAFQSDMSVFEFSPSPFTSGLGPSSESPQTVSPRDVFHTEMFSSAPPSTTFTNITTPDIGESPYMGYDTSPFFQAEDGIGSGSYSGPLFPDGAADDTQFNVAPEATALERTVSSTSMARTSSVESSKSPLVLGGTHRRNSSKTSLNGSPAMNAGINKQRRRKAPLGPIVVQDPSDKVELKRARNTLAARESRERKFKQIQTLEQSNAELAAQVEVWKSRAVSLGYIE